MKKTPSKVGEYSQISYIFSTVTIGELRTKSESCDQKLKFDWLNFIIKDPKFWAGF